MDNNEPITEHGLFWLRDNQQRKLWGTLHVNDLNEAKLETFGSLIDPSDVKSHTIVGQIRSGIQFVTLINCFPTSTNHSWLPKDGETDWTYQTCLVNTVVVGKGFENGEEISFEQATLYISTLSKWANPNLVKLDFTEGKNKPVRVNISIEERADENVTVNFRGEHVKISLVFQPKEEWSSNRVVTRYLVEDQCFLTIERADGRKMPLESILSVVGAILDLLGICCNETPKGTSFSVHHEKDEARAAKRLAKVYLRMRGYDAKIKQGDTDVALGLEDLGGMRVIKCWLKVTERYDKAVGLLTSNWYNEKAYIEDKMSRMYAAVEGLVSRKKNRNRAKITATELAQFVDGAIPDFSSITKTSPEEWAEKAKEIRDQKLSHSDPTSTVANDGKTMYLMTNVLYIAGASFLLREMGMTEDQIEKYIHGCRYSLALSDQQ